MTLNAVKVFSETLGRSAEASVATAQTTTALVKGQSAADVAVQLVQVLVSLGVVLGFIFAIVWFIKKQKGFRIPEREMQLIERLSIGQKDQLVLVQVGGKRLLLGVNPGGISRLHSYPAAGQAPVSHEADQCEALHGKATPANGQVDQEVSEQGQGRAPGFATYLNQVLQSKVAP
ncbi:flagellar biosynthetic protein FliO [Simiduia sp. 21SJ11W-1]|uniref:flagellar biosynthetic protein FliO n=1 Tax=Simiduia sp. 21SJ11W-1 TaxID=2909669 RepID=UPI00209C8615|nr:flagellar biosynthetic protein FliO [Simiduia sp. 21SJ11W-1]UTA49495.1 flagellar biosynthetic protein FliO [Simiduia sp. 21SJ11W-1]